MADPKQVKRLKRGAQVDPNGVSIPRANIEDWNAWRDENRNIRVDLSGIDLRGASLSGIDLRGANLRGANLSRVNLKSADLLQADLVHASLIYTSLSKANLSKANLSRADLNSADLLRASLAGALLYRANLSGARLSETNLSGANLSGANLSETFLRGVDLHNAIAEETVFARVDLHEVKGLAQINHKGPSRIELHTIQLPHDGSALHFLRGAGVSDEWIDLWRSTMMHPVQYHSLFISYCSKDETLAYRLYADLQAKGVRCWFAPEDMKIGEKIRSRIDEAIHVQDKLLLLLSKHSIVSEWVADEVEAALEKEQRQQREVLFPVRLDDTVMQTSQAWAAKLRRTCHIGDFTRWTDPQAYQQAFERLLRDLKAERETDGQPGPP